MPIGRFKRVKRTKASSFDVVLGMSIVTFYQAESIHGLRVQKKWGENQARPASQPGGFTRSDPLGLMGDLPEPMSNGHIEQTARIVIE